MGLELVNGSLVCLDWLTSLQPNETFPVDISIYLDDLGDLSKREKETRRQAMDGWMTFCANEIGWNSKHGTIFHNRGPSRLEVAADRSLGCRIQDGTSIYRTILAWWDCFQRTILAWHAQTYPCYSGYLETNKRVRIMKRRHERLDIIKRVPRWTCLNNVWLVILQFMLFRLTSSLSVQLHPTSSLLPGVIAALPLAWFPLNSVSFLPFLFLLVFVQLILILIFILIFDRM